MNRAASGFEKNEPLYMSLAREIRTKILNGTLTPGERMPTVKEMCEESGLSAGTVRQAYGLLQTEGLIELTPGRGTFVSVPKVNEKSRKAQALEAIDDLFITLSSMGFSHNETRMLLTLRLAQKDQEANLIPVAVVAESPEELRSVYDRLSDITGIEITYFSAEEIRSAGNVILSEFALVAAPVKLQSELTGILAERASALCPVAYAPSTETVMQLSGISEKSRVCVYTQTEAYAKLVRMFVKRLLPGVHLSLYTAGKLPSAAALSQFDHLITSPDLAAFAPDNEIHQIRAFSVNEKKTVPFELSVDEGSLLAFSRQLQYVLKNTHSR